MKKGLKALLLLLIFPMVTKVYPETPNTANTMKDLAIIHSMYPRLEGTKGEKKLIKYIEKELNTLKVPFVTSNFDESDLVHSFSQNIEVTIKGKKEDTLIVAIPLNHQATLNKNSDGAINLALGLMLITELTKNTPPISIKFLFLGAEFGESGNYPMGSNLFLKNFNPTYKTAVIYLNMRNFPSRLYIRSGARGIVAPYWILQETTKALKSTNIYFLVRGNENQIFRTSIAKEKTIIEPFLKNEFPAISFEGEYNTVSQKEMAQFISSFKVFFTELLKNFSKGFPEEWDKHYLFFQAKDFYTILSEKLYIIIYLSLFIIIISYSLIFTDRIKKYYRTIVKNFWSVPLIFGVTFLILFISTLTLESISQLKQIPTIWQKIPIYFLIEKILISIFLYALFYNFLRKLPISHNGSFYSAVAVLFLLIDVFVLTLINISYTYYFTWALLFTILFTIAPNRYLKLFFFLISPYWLIKASSELFILHKIEFIRIVLLSGIKGNLLLSIVVQPFLFMIIRLGLLFPPISRKSKDSDLKRNREKRRIKIAILAFIPAIVFLAYFFFLYHPYNRENPQPIKVTEYINMPQETNTLILQSPAPIGNLIYYSGVENPVNIQTNSRKYSMPINHIPKIITYKEKSQSFLDRKNYELTLIPKGEPYKIQLKVKSESEFILYDSNFPFLRDKSGKNYTISIGQNPPIPLTVELTLPQNMNFEILLEIKYIKPPIKLMIYGKDIKTDNLVIVKDKISLKT